MENIKSKCLICDKTYPRKGLAFFEFPKEENRLNMWIKEISPLLNILNITSAGLIENGKVCAKHFKKDDFLNSERNSLVDNACPSLGIPNENLTLSGEEEICDTSSEQEKSDLIDKQTNGIQERDTFQCGTCKIQFKQLSQFVDHKRSHFEITETLQDIPEKTATAPDNTPLPLGNTFLISFEKKLPETTNSVNKSGEMIKMVSEELPNGIVSYVMDNNGMLMGGPVDLSVLGGQVVYSPEMSVEGRTVFLNHPVADGNIGSFVLTTDATNNLNGGEVLLTYPVANGSINNGMVLTSLVPNLEPVSQVVLTSALSNTLPENVVQDGTANFNEVNNTDNDTSQLQLLTPNLYGQVYEEQLTVDGESQVARSEETEPNEFARVKNKLSCSFCDKVFDKPFNLQQHERVHTGERPFQCIICGRAFSQKSNVRKHMIRHKVWPQAKQTLKISVDQNRQSLSQNLLDQMNYSCQYCSLSFKSYSLHKKHLTVHSNFKVYRCIQKGCDDTFSDLDEFLSHSKMHSSAEFQCHICLKSFSNLEELGAHQYDHDPTDRNKKDIEGKLKCEVCHSQFKTAESLKNHLAVDTHNYECPHCQSVFNSERFLRRHLVTHMDPSESKYKCTNCKKTFRTQKYLNNHVFIHLKEKPFNCEHCDKQFASKYRLKRHLAIHLNQHFECPFKTYLGCDKTFYRKDKLRDHVTTHSHCRLRSCQVCSKTHSLVNQHVKKGVRLSKRKGVLKCSQCSQTFRKQKQLAQHNCTVGERKFRSRVRNTTLCRNSESINGTEKVSNIEIIMVPYVSDCKSGQQGKVLT